MKGLSFVKDLKVGQKMTAVVLSLLIPLIVATGLLVSALSDDINFSAKEIDGVHYIKPVRELLENIAKHRGMGNGYLNGDKSFGPKLDAVRAKIDADLQRIDTVDNSLGSILETTAAWEQIKQEWASLNSGFERMDAESSFRAHTVLIDKVLAHIVHVGDTSNLILDPDLDSFYLMDMVVNKLPVLSEKIGVMRGTATGIAAKGSLDREENIRLVSLSSEIMALNSQVAAGLATSFRENESLATALRQGFDQQQAAVNRFVEKVNREILSSDTVSAAPGDVFSFGTKAIDATLSLFDQTAPELERLLQDRVDRKRLIQYEELGGITIVMVLSCLLAWWIGKSLSRSIVSTRKTLAEIGEGNYTNEITVDSRDELGQMQESLKCMQSNLRERIEHERELSNEALRVKSALDSASAGVMMADADFDIVYMNESVHAMLKDAEEDLRKVLPEFDADNLVGKSIDTFHKNPAHQRGMLEGLSATYRTEIKVGGRTFGLIATPVFNDTNERLGTAVEWTDRTVEVAIEEEVDAIVTAASNGDLGQRLSLTGKTGFFMTLSQGINQLVEVCDGAIQDTVRVLGAMSQGDLTQRIERDYGGAFGHLKRDANATADKLVEIIGEIRASADEVGSAAGEISSGNQNLSQRTESQAASLEETAASMEQMTSTIKQNADNARQANQLSMGAREQAEKGGEVVSHAVSAMNGINESSKKVADIIGTIDEIAFQTNLLALNAAVEAARAGEQGRGFAVVASEVRNLAQRSAEAAKEIKELIQDSVSKVDEGTQLVGDSGRTLEEIVTSVKKVSDIIAEIAAASQEQAQGIDQVNKAVTQLDDTTQQNAALVEEAAAASEAMQDQATNLTRMMAFFKVGSHGASPSGSAPAYTGEERRGPDRPFSPPAPAACRHDHGGDLDFQAARQKHLSWRTRLRKFLAGEEAMTRDQAVSHRDCDLGKWIYGQALERFGHMAEMQELEQIHEQLHGVIKNIVNMKHDNDAVGAQQEFEKVEPMSGQVVELLTAIEQKVQSGGAQAAPVSTPAPVAAAAASTPAPEKSNPSGNDQEWEEF